MVSELMKKLETANEVEKKRWTEETNGLKKFLASKGWPSNLNQQRNVRSYKTDGEAAFISEEHTRKCGFELSKKLSFFDCQDIAS